jgi:hypothetical protein
VREPSRRKWSSGETARVSSSLPSKWSDSLHWDACGPHPISFSVHMGSLSALSSTSKRFSADQSTSLARTLSMPCNVVVISV